MTGDSNPMCVCMHRFVGIALKGQADLISIMFPLEVLVQKKVENEMLQ